MIEAEVKARVRDTERVRGLLRHRAPAEPCRYFDTYYDLPGHPLERADRELRLRVAETDGQRRCLLTYKGAAVDEQTRSKPETETEIADPVAADEILLALGFSHLVAFEKHCENYTFTASGRQMTVTLATVPGVGGTFIEAETLTPSEADLSAALDDIRALLADLGIPASDLTTELYTDAVMRHRSRQG
ncbi:MAG TPA: class IV adenylate cyclase [Streptosporangiaceae bacterium]|nr:class IV adenylate cyclase [Streptosporangiaceae bacterium]